MTDSERAMSAWPAAATRDAIAPAPPTKAAAPSSAISPRSTLLILASLFFIWGFAAVLNNTLLPHLREVFDFTYTQEVAIGSVWFVAFFSTALPAARLIKRIGHRLSVVAGLSTMASGALLMFPAAFAPSYALALLALFAIAAGATLLEVSANPYVAVVGPPETASSRLNFVQAFNSLGTTLAPLVGGWLILARSRSGSMPDGAASMTRAERLVDAHTIALPYALMAAVLVVLAVVMLRLRLTVAPEQAREPGRSTGPLDPLWRHRNLVWGILGICLYEVAEVGCANLFINLAGQPNVGHLAPARAADLLFLLWSGMMVGRLGGSALMRYVRPERVLAGASVLAFLVLLVTAFGDGQPALWALISVGLFHSVMFPTIFTLAIRGLGPLTEAGSGLLIMAIGGGVLVVAQGWLADLFGPQRSFLLPAACELYVLFYALRGSCVSSGTGTRPPPGLAASAAPLPAPLPGRTHDDPRLRILDRERSHHDLLHRTTGAPPMVRTFTAAIALATLSTVCRAETRIERGRYLVEVVAACGACHSPVDENGDRKGPALSGGPALSSPAFVAYPPNITPDSRTGIGSWTEGQIAAALRDGRRPDGRILRPPMPIALYHAMSDDDVGAIAAYLRTLAPVDHQVPTSTYNVPVPMGYGAPAVGVAGPRQDDPAAYGAYLAKLAHCAQCHTPLGPDGKRDEVNSLGAGGLSIDVAWGSRVSANITPDPQTGIGTWSDDQIIAAVSEGTRPDGTSLSPIMPWRYWREMKPADLGAIVTWLRTLKPVSNAVVR